MMHDDPAGRGKGRNRRGVAQGEELANRMRRLGDSLGRHGRARDAEEKARNRRADNSGFAYALRLSTEFVAAILVGAAIGWGIDRLLGLAPWGMVVFLLLGFCAGVLNVMRAAGRISQPHERLAEKENDDGDRTGS